MTSRPYHGYRSRNSRRGSAYGRSISTQGAVPVKTKPSPGEWVRVKPGALHRRLAKRLAIGGLAIATLLGGIMLGDDLAHLHAAIVARTVGDADWLAAVVPPDLDALDAAGKAAIAGRLAEGITARSANPRGHFAMAALYDRAQRTVTVSLGREGAELAPAIGFPHPPKALHGRIRLVGGEVYVEVATALHRADGTQVGWFEGVYHLPRPALVGLVRVGLRTSILVVAAVLMTTALLYPVIAALNHGLIRRSVALLYANLGTLEALGSAIAKRDSDTNSHNYRVTLGAVRLAEAVHLPRARIRALIKGAFLHDVGKLAIRDAVLLKPGGLAPEETAIMHTHVAHGLDIVTHIHWLADAADVVGGHHEWYDGSGYPRGLRGEEIPRTARIFAIADVFDALTSRRPYKPAFSLETSLALLAEGRGTHFDPVLLDAFLAIAPTLYAELADCEDRRLERKLRAVTHAYFADTLLG